MKNDHQIIRLTLTTSFFHSLIASLLILLNMNTLFARNYENGLYVGKLAEFFVQEITNNHIIGRVIAVAIILFVAYSIIYPIGQAAIIHYFNSGDRSIKAALKKWRENFFPMFEYGIVSLLLAPLVYWLVILKIIVSGNPLTSFTVFMLLFWFVAMSVINCLKIYTRYIMIIEGKWVYEAVIKSCNLSLKNFKEGMKYLGVQTNLIVNFSLNIFIILLIPIVLIYLAIVFNIIQYPAVKRSVYGLFFLGIIFGSYASSMVRAFCAYLRREIYKKVTKESKWDINKQWK